MKTYYEVLEVARTASKDEIKHAFRDKISRYHPDKVQHLGDEFQKLAEVRSSELTEAYRVLTDETRRSEYDRMIDSLAQNGTRPQAAPEAPAEPRPQRPTPPPRASHKTPPRPTPSSTPPPPWPPAGETNARFKEERASRDELVRRATVVRLRDAIVGELGTCDASPVVGFDVSASSRASKLFGRNQKIRLLGRFVSHIDGPAIADVWATVARTTPSDTQSSVFLMSADIASQGELAAAIAQQRRRGGSAGPGSIVLIPVDVRDWTALVPTDAPKLAKAILDRLKAP